MELLIRMGRCSSKVARRSDLTTALIEMLAGDALTFYRAELAQLSASGYMLRKLSTDDSTDVRQNVANNPSTPAAILFDLASDPSDNVRVCVANNTNTPIAALETLSRDSLSRVKTGVADNPSAPLALVQAVLTELSRDPYDFVREYALRHEKATPQLLLSLARDPSEKIRRLLLWRSSSEEVLQEMLRHETDPQLKRDTKRALRRLEKRRQK